MLRRVAQALAGVEHALMAWLPQLCGVSGAVMAGFLVVVAHVTELAAGKILANLFCN